MTETVDFVSLAFPTVMDGTVVRWYASLDAAEHHDPVASASRNKVEFYRETVHARIRDAAEAAHRELAADRHADVRHYTTHVRNPAGVLVARGGA